MQKEHRCVLSNFHKYFVLRKGNQYLFCFGATHTFDPKHWQFYKIEKLWNEFLELNKGKKCVVLVEGGKRHFTTKSRDVVIRNDGEAGFISLLARKKRIPTISPEPSDRLERRELLKEFSKEDIQLYYFARYAYQWSCLTWEIKFERYLNDFFKQDKIKSGWKNFDFSIPHMKSHFYKTFKISFNPTDKDFLYSIINPTNISKITNRISKRSGEIRDDYIV